MKTRIRKGDKVIIISGREEDRGKVGEVIRISTEDSRVVVQGVNLRKKHKGQVRTQGRRDLNPGIIEFEAPISISNVMLVCPTCNEATRVNIQRTEDSVSRVCKKCKAQF